MKKFIFVQTRFEGFHRWEKAPHEVGFLRSLHRHEFRVKLTLEVKHDDRELEFFIVKKWLEKKVIPALLTDDDGKSCEHMASDIIKAAHAQYGFREVTCEVSEDGENGAILTET